MDHDVFISYSSHDKATADDICSALEERGVKCWIAPRDVLAGVVYAAAIVNAIKACRVLLLVLSTEANVSPQVQREVERAVSLGVPIMPVLLQDLKLSEHMEYFISTSHWLDMTQPPLEMHFDKLASNVRTLLADRKTPEVKVKEQSVSWDEFQNVEIDSRLETGEDLEDWEVDLLKDAALETGSVRDRPALVRKKGVWYGLLVLLILAAGVIVYYQGRKPPEYFLNRGHNRLNQADYDGAITDYSQVLALDPDNVSAFIYRGMAHYSKGEYQQAVKDLSQALKIDPNSSKAYNFRGMTYYLLGYLDPAVQDYDQALKLDPNNTLAYHNRADVYYRQGDYDRALVDYDKSLALDPENAKAHDYRGIIYSLKGEYDRAVKDFLQALKIDPNDALAHKKLGDIQYIKGEYSQAIDSYDQALDLDPRYTMAYFNRGIVWISQGDYDRAIADYGQAITLDGKYAAAYYHRGIAWEKKGDLVQALADSKKALTLEPDKQEYQKRVAELEYKLGRQEKNG